MLTPTMIWYHINNTHKIWTSPSILKSRFFESPYCQHLALSLFIHCSNIGGYMCRIKNIKVDVICYWYTMLEHWLLECTQWWTYEHVGLDIDDIKEKMRCHWPIKVTQVYKTYFLSICAKYQQLNFLKS